MKIDWIQIIRIDWKIRRRGKIEAIYSLCFYDDRNEQWHSLSLSLSHSLNKDWTRNFLQAINVAACISKRSDFALIDLSLARFRRVHISIARKALIVPGRWSVRWHTGGWQRYTPVERREPEGGGGIVARVGKRGSTGFPNSWKFVKLPWPIGEHLIEDKWPWFFHQAEHPFRMEWLFDSVERCRTK